MADVNRVVSLVPVAAREADPEVVAAFRDLLARAEAGEIRGVAAAIDRADGRPMHLLAIGNGTSPASLVLTLGLLKRKVEDRYLAELEDPR